MLNKEHDVRRPANLALKSTRKLLLALMGVALISISFGLAAFPASRAQ